MNNYKIVIDPGHGGTDPGASSNGIIEKDLTLKISKYMKEKLEKEGIPVSITRDKDETLSPKERVERIKKMYGNTKDVLVISNHINAGGGDGLEVIYALRNTDKLASSIANEVAKTPQNVRKIYQRRLPSDPSKDYYFIIRDTLNNESIIVEYGFLDSPGDDVNLLKNNWQELTDAVVNGILKYIGKKPTSKIPKDNTYIVQPGDTLWSIAKKNNTTVDNLKKINNLTSNLLTIGESLKITDTNNKYIVKKGDTLYKIANNNNTTVDELKKLNNLTNNTLSINQILIIPENNTNRIYTVKKGDSLYSIAKNYNTTVSQLKSINNLNTDLLTIGQKLIIP